MEHENSRTTMQHTGGTYSRMLKTPVFVIIVMLFIGCITTGCIKAPKWQVTVHKACIKTLLEASFVLQACRC